MTNVSSSNSQKANVPKLRFPEFTEEWKTNYISEISSYIKGAPLSKADISESGTPFILYGELYTTYKEVTTKIIRKTNCNVDDEYYSKIGDVIIPTSGETPEEIATATCIMTPNVILAGDLNIFRVKEVDGRFFSYIVNHKINKEIARIAQGKSVVHIKGEEISKIPLKYPSSKEQEKILNFIELISSKIEKQEQLIKALKSYKRGVLNDIFSRKISFSLDEITDWQCVKISDCLSYEQPQKYIVNSENYSNEYLTPVLTANKAFILGYTNELDGIYKKGNVIIYDDFTMDTKYVDFDFKVKSSTIKMLTPKKDVDLYFMYNYFQYLNLVPEGHKRSYISIIEPMVIKIPNYDIQKQIAAFLYKIDLRLKNQQEQLIKMSNLKNGLLQQMFI